MFSLFLFFEMKAVLARVSVIKKTGKDDARKGEENYIKERSIK